MRNEHGINSFVYVFLLSVVLLSEVELPELCNGSGVYFSLCHHIQIDPGPHPASNSVSVPELGLPFSGAKLPLF
jgi:hypothetical protein